MRVIVLWFAIALLGPRGPCHVGHHTLTLNASDTLFVSGFGLSVEGVWNPGFRVDRSGSEEGSYPRLIDFCITQR